MDSNSIFHVCEWQFGIQLECVFEMHKGNQKTMLDSKLSFTHIIVNLLTKKPCIPKCVLLGHHFIYIFLFQHWSFSYSFVQAIITPCKHAKGHTRSAQTLHFHEANTKIKMFPILLHVKIITCKLKLVFQFN